MRNTKLILIANVLGLGTALMVTGCMSHGGLGGAGRGIGSASVLATVEGIDQKDRDNEKVDFWLRCRSGHQIKGEGKTGDVIKFSDASKVSATDSCWIEVRMEEADAKTLEYDWFGIKSDKTADVGLLYGSTEDTVGTKRAMDLTVYKLYSPKTARAFSAVANLKFDGVDAALLPAEDKTTGALVCGPKSYPGTFKKDAADANLATVSFEKLDAKEMAGAECKKIVLLVDNKEGFSGDMTYVFDHPKKDDVLELSKKDAPILLKVSTGGDIDIGTQNGGPCLVYVTGDPKPCKDVRSIALPFAENFVLAKVKGKRGVDGEVVTFMVAAGQGVDLLKKGELSLADVKTELSINEVSAFTIYNHTIQLEDSMLKAAFDAEMIKGTAFAASKASKDDLKDVTLLHIDTVYVHGFHDVTEAALNLKTSAIWMATVKATKSGQADKEFVVGGKDKYFRSSSAPLAGKYFDLATLVSDMKAAGSDKWLVYALKGKAMAAAGCEAESATYDSALSSRHLGTLNGADAKLDACEVAKAGFDLNLEGATAVPAFKVWEWFKL